MRQPGYFGLLRITTLKPCASRRETCADCANMRRVNGSEFEKFDFANVHRATCHQHNGDAKMHRYHVSSSYGADHRPPYVSVAKAVTAQ